MRGLQGLLLASIALMAIGSTIPAMGDEFGADTPAEKAAYNFIAYKAEESLRVVTSDQSTAVKTAFLRDFFSDENFAWTPFCWNVIGGIAKNFAPSRKFKNPEDEEVFSEYVDLMRRYFASLYVKYLKDYDVTSFKVVDVIDRSKPNRPLFDVKTQIAKSGESKKMDIIFEICSVEGELRVCNAVLSDISLMVFLRNEHDTLFYQKADWKFSKLVEIFREKVLNAETE